jgi:DNA-binding PadR family transcriptional regulator
MDNHYILKSIRPFNKKQKILAQGAFMVRRSIEFEEKIPIAFESQEYYKKIIERIIKVNRDIIILSELLDEQMCGYDLIKEIFSRSDVFLSQGTVYPVLYSLEEEGLLQAEFSKGDMRAKKYSLTPKGREVAHSRIDEFAKALEQVLVIIQS